MISKNSSFYPTPEFFLSGSVLTNEVFCDLQLNGKLINPDKNCRSDNLSIKNFKFLFFLKAAVLRYND